MIIGIDMGTTNSAVAVVEGESDAQVLGPPGELTIPSIIHFDGESLTVGARLASGADAANSFSGIKRLLGRKAHSEEVEHLAQTVPYRIAASPTGDCWVRVGDRLTSPQELAGALLRALRVRAEDQLEQPVTRAVLAVPAYFDDSQRQAVRDAGHVAGLEVVRLINEPTAAALAYGMARTAKESKTVAVFDLGGGTFDVSILRVENDVFSVLASHGDASLGGDDWDRRIVDLLSDELFSEHRFDATSSAAALVALRDAAEKAKIDLTSAETTSIAFVIEPKAGAAPIRIERVLTREELESETADLCYRLAAPCRRALIDAEVDRSDLDEVLLVGGMTHAPMIGRAVRELLGEPSSGQLDPSTAVARGAAICAAIIDGSDSPTTLLDVSSHSVGIRVGDIELPRALARGQELPARRMIRLEVPAQLISGLTVELFRGESDDLEENSLVGRVLLELGSPASEATEPRELELTIAIDVNSIVSVEAFDVATGTVAKSRLRTRGALSQSQLVRIVGDGDDLGLGVVAGGD